MIAKNMIYDIRDLDPSIDYKDYDFSKNDFDLIDYNETPGETPYIPVAFQDSLGVWHKVTSIGRDAFEKCRNLESITIPNSVTSIGDYAFSNCTSLTSITIPDSVTSIGRAAFFGCHNLTCITIPDSVTFVGTAAFRNCNSSSSFSIPKHLESEHESCFGKQAKITVRPTKSIADDVLENDAVTIGIRNNAPSRDDIAR